MYKVVLALVISDGGLKTLHFISNMIYKNLLIPVKPMQEVSKTAVPLVVHLILAPRDQLGNSSRIGVISIETMFC